MLFSRVSWRLSIGVLSAVVALAPAPASASQWSERTELTFSDPVMVPGATLQPGTYIFKLVNPDSNQQIVQILEKDGSEVVTTTVTVPTKRQNSKGDNVLKFNPTEEGAPPALAAWFYPGTIYGHQFVYPEEQAKKIAQRTKTIVLSTDVPGTDAERGKLRVFDASGVAKEWTPDKDAVASFEQWRRNRGATARVMTEKAEGERGQAIAPAVDAEFKGTRVKLDELEDNPKQYIGKTVSVDAEVEEVFGPRLFTIDEPRWGDLEGELLVYVPTALAAVVRDDDRITVSGTVKPFVEADFDKEWGWLGLDKELEVELSRRPVLVASRIVGGNNSTAVIVKAGDTRAPVGTSGGAARAAAGGAITAITSLADAGEGMIGRSVDLTGVTVQAKAKDRGFFVKSGDTVVFVLPEPNLQANVRQGETVSIEGMVLQMPRHMDDQLSAPSGGTLNEDIYVYATRIER